MKNSKAVRVVLGMVHHLSPFFLPVLLVQVLVQTAVPYIDIVYSSRIIDSLLGKRPFDEIFHLVLWMIVLNCLFNLVY